eukprot:181195-Rhodomonas_salina.2
MKVCTTTIGDVFPRRPPLASHRDPAPLVLARRAFEFIASESEAQQRRGTAVFQLGAAPWLRLRLLRLRT